MFLVLWLWQDRRGKLLLIENLLSAHYRAGLLHKQLFQFLGTRKLRFGEMIKLPQIIAQVRADTDLKPRCFEPKLGELSTAQWFSTWLTLEIPGWEEPLERWPAPGSTLSNFDLFGLEWGQDTVILTKRLPSRWFCCASGADPPPSPTAASERIVLFNTISGWNFQKEMMSSNLKMGWRQTIGTPLSLCPDHQIRNWSPRSPQKWPAVSQVPESKGGATLALNLRGSRSRGRRMLRICVMKGKFCVWFLDKTGAYTWIIKQVHAVILKISEITGVNGRCEPQGALQ